jgi:hypothetical protein
MSECHATNLNRRLPAFDHMTAVALAEMGLALGRPGRVLKQLADVAAHGLGTADPLIRIQALPAFAAASARAAQRDQAATAAANFENWFTAAGSTPNLALLARIRALLAPTVPAMTTFEQALRLHAASRRPFDRARTELLNGESLRRRRKRLQAREHLRAANELFERLSADPWAERARTELRASGETPRRRDPGRAQQLTPQSTRSPASSLQAPLARKPQPGSSSAREPSTRTFAASTPSSASPSVVNCKPPILTTSDPSPRTRMTWVEPTHRTGRSASSARAIRCDSRVRRFGDRRWKY